jgi:hypothetical protein
MLRRGGYRFFFFSKEETRVHVHVSGSTGEAKFWLEPDVELARSSGLNRAELRQVQRIVQEHADEFKTAWRRRFRS